MNQEEKRKIRKALRFLQYLVLSLDNVQHHVDATGADYAEVLTAFNRKAALPYRSGSIRQDLASFFDDTVADGEALSPYEKMILHVDYWRWPGVRESEIEDYAPDDVNGLDVPSAGSAREKLLQASCFMEMLVVSLARIGSCVDDPDVDEEEIRLRFYEDFDIYRQAVEVRDGLCSYLDPRVVPGDKKSERQRALTGVRAWRWRGRRVLAPSGS